MSYDYKNMMGELITESSLLHKIIDIIRETPNDKVLGKRLREVYFEVEDNQNQDQMNLFGEGDY